MNSFREEQRAKNERRQGGRQGGGKGKRERDEVGRKWNGLFTNCNLAYLHGVKSKKRDDRAVQELVSPPLLPLPRHPERTELTVFLSRETPSLPIQSAVQRRGEEGRGGQVRGRVPFRIPAHEYARLLPGNSCERTIFHYPILFFRENARATRSRESSRFSASFDPRH